MENPSTERPDAPTGSEDPKPKLPENINDPTVDDHEAEVPSNHQPHREPFDL